MIAEACCWPRIDFTLSLSSSGILGIRQGFYKPHPGIIGRVSWSLQHRVKGQGKGPPSDGQALWNLIKFDLSPHKKDIRKQSK